MSSASDTTYRRQQRVLYADRIIQQTIFNNKINNHIVLEGGNYGGAMGYPTYYRMRDGAIETTPEERQSYIDSVPGGKTIPGAPTGV
jgi:hypothetical protein